jgi:DNA-nicking Smr family endonuclease
MGTQDTKPPDDELFRQAVDDVKPLPQDRADPYRQRRRPVPLELPVGDEDREAPGDREIETPDFLEYRRPGVQQRVYQDLKRGVVEPQASLDLHGMRVENARKAFTLFLAQSVAARRQCVRIVHGKGRRSAEGQPVLKQKTYQWLQQRDEVLAFCSAPRWDGGTGATYVLLSRKAHLRR